MDGRQNRDGLFGDIDAREDSRGLRDTRETLVENLSREMAELQVDVVLLGTNTTTLADLNRHRARDDIAGSKILRSGRVTFHEPLTLRVQQVSALTTRTYNTSAMVHGQISPRTLSDKTAGTVDTSWVELHKLEVLEGQTCTGDHGIAITRAGVRTRTAEVCTSVTTSREDGLVCPEAVECAVLHIQCDNADTFAVLHD